MGTLKHSSFLSESTIEEPQRNNDLTKKRAVKRNTTRVEY
jgi:hypothetical protein